MRGSKPAGFGGVGECVAVETVASAATDAAATHVQARENYVVSALGSTLAAQDGSRRGVHAGVRVGWLKEFVRKHRLTSSTTTRAVVSDIICAETAAQRCRYVDTLRAEDVGRATTFVSHTWGAPFISLVASVASVRPDDCYVWCDIFAIMQHNPPGPEVHELDFAAVVSECSSLILVGQHMPSIVQMDMDKVFSKAIPEEAKRVCAFFRVWCIVELEAALQAGIPVILLVSTGEEQRGGSLTFRAEHSMLPNLLYLVDVEQAAATREADKLRILADVRATPGGTAGVDTLAKQAILQSMGQTPEILQAAFGDLRPLASLRGREQLERALRTAAVSNLVDPIKALLARAPKELDMEAREPLSGYTALVVACQSGAEHAVRVLLAAGADPHVTAPEGTTPLMLASSQGHVRVVRIMLDAKVDPNARHHVSGGTALMTAAFGCHAHCIKELLRGGAAVEGVDFNGAGALHRAAMNGAVSSLEALIAHGATVDRCSEFGTTPLMLAAMLGHAAAAEALASHGAALDLRRLGTEAVRAKAKGFADALAAKSTVHAAEAAAHSSFGGLSSALRGSSYATSTEMAAILGSGWYFRRLLSVVQMQALHLSGETALVDAVRGGHVDTVRVLLARGARLDVQDEAGRDALQMARDLSAEGDTVMAGSIWRNAEAAARASPTLQKEMGLVARRQRVLELLEQHRGRRGGARR